MQRYPAVVMKIAVKVPIQKASVSQSVTRQNAVILPPILFAVRHALVAAYFSLSVLHANVAPDNTRR